MTVGEFIEKLRQLPQDAVVYVDDWNEGYAEPVVAGAVFLQANTYHKKMAAGPFPTDAVIVTSESLDVAWR